MLRPWPVLGRIRLSGVQRLAKQAGAGARKSSAQAGLLPIALEKVPVDALAGMAVFVRVGPRTGNLGQEAPGGVRVEVRRITAQSQPLEEHDARLANDPRTAPAYAELGRRMLRETYDAPPERIDLIAHGIPDVGFVDPSYFKDQFGVEGRVVLLTFQEDRSADEIASELGTSAGNVRVLRHRAMLALQRCVTGSAA